MYIKYINKYIIYNIYIYIYKIYMSTIHKIILKTNLLITNILLSLQKLCQYNKNLTKHQSTQQLIQIY